jgi:drug/metabolite transporter (DMT)-like permease
MNWFWIALIAPIVWAASNHVDKYLLNRYVQKSNLGVLVVATSFVSLLLLPLLGIFVPGVFSISLGNAGLLLIAGALFLVYLFPYFSALHQDEASVVVPLYQIIPVFSYILAFIFLKEVLSLVQVIGSLIIIFSAIGLSLDFDTKIKLKKSVFWPIFFSALLVSIGTLLFKLVALEEGFWISMFWQILGTAVTGFSFLLITKFRSEFMRVLRLGRAKFLSMGILSEGLGYIGGFAISFATLLAPLALVQVVNGFQPVFVFFFGVLLTWFFPRIAKEDLSKKLLLQKILFISIMFVGTYLISLRV